jgi:hypothetical protein
MRLTVRKCRTCGALGLGPNAIDLWPLDGWLYCREDFKTALQWDEQRSHVVRGVSNLYTYQQDAVRRIKKLGYLQITKVEAKWDWRGYIQDCAGLAGWALEADDRRTFVYYFSRAMYAWSLMEGR